VAIVGAPNVGKSSLFNALVAANRAIVTPIPGTTRDVLSERADIRGLSVTLFDTAGLRESDDVIEQEGMARARAAAASADLVLIVLDRSRVLTRDDRAALAELRGSATLVVANKADLPAAWSPDVVGEPLVEVSAATGVGLDLVGEAMWETLGRRPDWSEDVLVTNVRHQRLLGDAASALTRASSALRSGGVPEEFVLADLQDASASLQEVTGRRTSEDVLRAIFERFCIGK
jgi:tRNA modification GTPase